MPKRHVLQCGFSRFGYAFSFVGGLPRNRVASRNRVAHPFAPLRKGGLSCAAAHDRSPPHIGSTFIASRTTSRGGKPGLQRNVKNLFCFKGHGFSRAASVMFAMRLQPLRYAVCFASHFFRSLFSPGVLFAAHLPTNQADTRGIFSYVPPGILDIDQKKKRSSSPSLELSVLSYRLLAVTLFIAGFWRGSFLYIKQNR